MSTGKTSNHIDSGYNVSSLTIYNSSNAIISTSTSNSDIYTTTATFGVILANSNSSVYPVYCSSTNMTNLGIPAAVDDYYIVYPGWGFILYNTASYGGTSTRQYMNNTTSPILFTSVTVGGVSVNILSSTGGTYGVNQTRSIKIYFRGVEVTVTGLS